MKVKLTIHTRLRKNLEAQREEQRAMGIAPHYTYEYEGMTADEIKEVQAAAGSKRLKASCSYPHS